MISDQNENAVECQVLTGRSVNLGTGNIDSGEERSTASQVNTGEVGT